MQRNMEHTQPPSTRTFFSFGATGALIWVILVALLGGCRDDAGLTIDRNAPPETVLTGAPGDSQTAFYTVKLYWSGFDPDGEVIGYEWATTESLPDPATINYKFTTRTDSTFRFRVEPNSEVLGHRFYVRAVDNEGKRDPSPAFTFFAARNTCAPKVVFTRSVGISPTGETRPITSTSSTQPTDTIPSGWSVSFAWRGEDCDAVIREDGIVDTVGRIERYFYKLAPREVSERGGAISDTTAFYDASVLGSQSYYLFVRPVDDAGFSGLEPAVRSFTWNLDPVASFSKALLPGYSDSVSVCYIDTTGLNLPLDQFVPFAGGDTLALPQSGVGIRLWARIRGYDPDDPTGAGSIFERQARVIQDTGLWQTVPGDTIFYADQLFTDRNGWKLMCRVRDRYGRYDGTPDSIVFYVNRAARFQKNWTLQGVEYTQTPLPGEVITVTPGQTELPIRFAAHDPDGTRGVSDLEFRWKFDRYPVPNSNGTAQEAQFGDWVRGARAGDVSILAPAGDVTAPFIVRLADPRHWFVPGEYTLRVQTEEFRSGDSALGKRISTRVVRFTIVEG